MVHFKYRYVTVVIAFLTVSNRYHSLTSKLEIKISLLWTKENYPANGSIMSEINGSVLIRDDQKFQDVMNGCTPLKFDILYSFQYSQQLIMSPWFEEDSFYLTIESSKRSVNIKFLACIDCPIGFQKTINAAKGCDCVCNKLLGPYIINCSYTGETITKKGTITWITYLSIKNTSDFLIYPCWLMQKLNSRKVCILFQH